MGGTNLYQYAPNPTGWIDPLGLMTSRVDPPEGCDCDGDGEDDTSVSEEEIYDYEVIIDSTFGRELRAYDDGAKIEFSTSDDD